MATMTGRRTRRATLRICRWMTGTRSGGNSTPRSPRATITSASLAATMLSMFSTASGGLDLGDDRRRRSPRVADLADLASGPPRGGRSSSRCSRRRSTGREPIRSALSFSVRAEMRIVLLGRCTPTLSRIPPPCSTFARTAPSWTPSTIEDEAPVVEEDAVVDPHVAGEALVLDGDDALVGRRVALDELHVDALRQVELAGNVCPSGSSGRTGPAGRRRTCVRAPVALRSVARASPLLLVGPVREVETRDVHPRGDEAAHSLERVARWAKGAHELRAAERHRDLQNRTRGARSGREPVLGVFAG